MWPFLHSAIQECSSTIVLARLRAERLLLIAYRLGRHHDWRINTANSAGRRVVQFNHKSSFFASFTTRPQSEVPIFSCGHGVTMSLPTVETQKTSVFAPCQTLKGHTNSITRIIHLSGGKRIITSSRDGSLRLWNTESGLQIGEDWRNGDSPVLDIALSPDEEKVVSGSEDGTMRLWDSGKMIAKWTGHTHAVDYVCWSESGQRVVSGCYHDGTIREWDVESGDSILGPLRTGHNFACAFAFSPKNALFAAAGFASQGEYVRYAIEIWDVKTRKLVTTLETSMSVFCLAWSPDGNKLVSGTGVGAITIWNRRWEVIATFTRLRVRMNAMEISWNGRVLAIASSDGGGLLNLENGEPIVGQLERATTCVSFSTDRNLQTCSFGPSRDESSLADGDYPACIYDVTAMLKEKGLEGLLLDESSGDDEKPVLDATRSSVQQSANIRQILHPDAFNDTTRSAPSHPPPRSSERTRAPSALPKPRSALLSPHYKATAPDRSSLARAPSPGQPPKQDQPSGEQHPVVVVAPKAKLTREAPRSIMTVINGTGSDNNVNTTLTAAATSDTMAVRQAGCWTRFRLFFCIPSRGWH